MRRCNTISLAAIAAFLAAGARASGAQAASPSAQSARGANEPAGMSLIGDRLFLARDEAGWTDYRAGNFSLVADRGAPGGRATVGQVLYPAGFEGGTEPVNLYAPLGDRTTLYLAFWLRMSPNFYGHPNSSVNKIFHIWIGGANRVYLAVMGSGRAASFEPQIRLQRVPEQASYNLGPNLVPGTSLLRDRWYKWEVVLRANTPGVADGSVEFWVDGARVARHTHVRFVARGERARWESINWAPTWGGVGGRVPADQWMRISEIYLSGR